MTLICRRLFPLFQIDPNIFLFQCQQKKRFVGNREFPNCWTRDARIASRQRKRFVELLEFSARNADRVAQLVHQLIVSQIKYRRSGIFPMRVRSSRLLGDATQPQGNHCHAASCHVCSRRGARRCLGVGRDRRRRQARRARPELCASTRAIPGRAGATRQTLHDRGAASVRACRGLSVVTPKRYASWPALVAAACSFSFGGGACGACRAGEQPARQLYSARA
jgi:hypothetical protein